MSDIFTEFTRLRMDVLAGRLDRRQVLKRGALLGLSAPLLASLLAACGGDDDETATAAPQATEAEAAGEATETPAEATAQPEAEATKAPAEQATEAPTEQPAAEAGGGGQLRLLWWQAPTIMNPRLSTGTKDFDAARLVYEPLADFDADGNGIPSLAAEMPTLENGGVSEDGLTVTWKLREGVTWHDGEPFNEDDVVFPWENA